eukprot:COSAG06_NODE_6329_length_2981_cov_26.469119_5_plen_199_part_00
MIFVSFCVVSCRFVSIRFVSFRFVSFRFVSFGWMITGRTYGIWQPGSPDDCAAGTKAHLFAMPFCTKHDRFTKTGSGQTQGTLREERCVFLQARRTHRLARAQLAAPTRHRAPSGWRAAWRCRRRRLARVRRRARTHSCRPGVLAYPPISLSAYQPVSPSACQPANLPACLPACLPAWLSVFLSAVFLGIDICLRTFG